MRWLAVGLIWLGYAGVVAAIAFGTKDADATRFTAMVAGFCAAFATACVASAGNSDSKSSG